MDRKNEWRKMQIVLPNDPDREGGLSEGLVSTLYSWHGGQSSAVYSLASWGDSNLVSLSMIDDALDELRSTLSKKPKPGFWSGHTRSEARELNNLINALSSVRLFWREYSAREYGMKPGGYDRVDRGMSAEEEERMVDHGEWSNPRKAMRGYRAAKRIGKAG